MFIIIKKINIKRKIIHLFKTIMLLSILFLKKNILFYNFKK